MLALALGAIQVTIHGRLAWRPSTWLAGGVLLVSSVQSAIELSFSNVLVTGIALVWLLSDRLFADLPHPWARLIEAQLVLLRSPTRWIWLVAALPNLRAVETMGNRADRTARAFAAAAPALALGAIFAVLLSGGNAILREWALRWMEMLSTWLWSFDLSVNRILFWLGVATLSLAFVRQKARCLAERIWSRTIPHWTRKDAVFACWQSGAILAVLNGLFFVVNTIDVIYLWRRAEVPSGVAYSEYVHEGVFSLIAAVLLSAVVLSGIFLQDSAVTGRGWLKGLAHLWILQNLVLIAGVFLRLKLYVDAYQFTVLRVYVAFFLVLVAVGFGLLAIYVERAMRFGWLLTSNAIATFSLFFIVQFTDALGWVAQANVRQWQRDPGRALDGRTLDLEYLESLGASGWPALINVAAQRRMPDLAAVAGGRLREIAFEETQRLTQQNWRSRQLRRDRAARSVIGYTGQPWPR